MALVRSWLAAAGDLGWGMLKRFYLWLYPFFFAQPVDILSRIGVHIVIPNEVIYALVAVGLFVSAVDVLHGHRTRLADAIDREDARAIVGTVEMTPLMIPADADDLLGVRFRPHVRLENKGTVAVVYSVQRFDVAIQRYSRVVEHASDAPIDLAESRLAFQPETASLPAPTTIYTVAPHAYMDANGPPHIFGPYQGMGNPIDVVIEIEVRLARPFANSTVVEHRRFTFRAFIHNERPKKGDARIGAATTGYSAEQEAPLYVRANIANESADWSFPKRSLGPVPDWVNR
jgi:hypothetical protein